jgi:diguanylate cyclase (GGDEF)-like protein
VSAPQRRFAPQLEPEYQAARFAEYRQFSIAVAIAGAALVLGLWLRDLTDDPVGARTTVPLRLVMASGVALYAASMWLQVRRSLRLAAGYIALIVIEFSVLAIWSRLASGYTGGFPGYLYIFIVAPLVLLPFSFRESAAALLLVGVVPNVQVLLGMAPGFPTAAFNALVWPACGTALFAQRQFDQLFRRVFLVQRELSNLARHDPLTGLANRRDFMARAEAQCAAARRYGRPLSVLMIDLDHFKAVNDRYGHAAGDDVLRFIAAVFSLKVRSTDVCARVGGEEFAVVLAETGLEGGLQMADRIRQAVASSPVVSERVAHPLRVTVSVGVTASATGATSLGALLRDADEALYRAKAEGRNCVRAIAAPQPRKAALGPRMTQAASA